MIQRKLGERFCVWWLRMVVGKCAVHEPARDRRRMGAAFSSIARLACIDRN